MNRSLGCGLLFGRVLLAAVLALALAQTAFGSDYPPVSSSVSGEAGFSGVAATVMVGIVLAAIAAWLAAIVAWLRLDWKTHAPATTAKSQ